MKQKNSYELIRNILMKYWDPYEVRNDIGSERDYDEYIPQIYNMLSSGKSADDIQLYLLSIEKDLQLFSNSYNAKDTSVALFHLTQDKVYIVEDEFHCEHCGEFYSFEDAFNEIKRRSNIPWNENPNKCPCISWKTCGRSYTINEYEISGTSWKHITKYCSILEISAEGKTFNKDYFPTQVS